MADKKWWKDVPTPPVGVRGTDSLEYVLIDPINRGVVNMGSQPCFSASRCQLDKKIWDAAPSANYPPLSPDKYLLWVRLCKINGVMPFTAEAYAEGKNLKIKMIGAYHQVFAGLNCYRWAVNTKVLPELVMNLLKKNENISFFQAFHYALRKYNYWSNHSFSDAINPHNAVYHAHPNNLWMSLSMCYFFRDWQNPNAPCHLPNPQNAYTMTWTAIQNWWNKEFGVKDLTYKEDDEVLLEKWTPLYNMKDPTKQKIKEYYDKVK